MRFGQTSGTKWPTPPRRDCAPLLLQRVYMCAINLVKCKKTTTAFGNIALTPHAGITDPQGHRDVMLLQLG